MHCTEMLGIFALQAEQRLYLLYTVTWPVHQDIYSNQPQKSVWGGVPLTPRERILFRSQCPLLSPCGAWLGRVGNMSLLLFLISNVHFSTKPYTTTLKYELRSRRLSVFSPWFSKNTHRHRCYISFTHDHIPSHIPKVTKLVVGTGLYSGRG